MNQATTKTKEEIKILREGGHRLAEILQSVVEKVKAGVSTYELDRLAESLIFKSGGRPSFKGYKPEGAKIPYPCSLCTSINDEVVHAIPDKKRFLKDGDVIGLDIGMQWPAFAKATAGKPGLFTDMAVTMGIGKVSRDAQKLIQATKESLDIGISAVRAGAKIGDIGFAIGSYLKKQGYGVIRDLAGHGVGYAVHESPFIPNFGLKGEGVLIREGMVLAIEPMATLGDWRVRLEKDHWTFKTTDRSLAAHFEHTIVVNKDGAEILTKF